MLELIFYSIFRIFSHSSDSQSSMTKNIFTSRSNQNQSPLEMLWKEFNYNFQSPVQLINTMLWIHKISRASEGGRHWCNINIVLCAVNVLIIMTIFGHKLIRWPWSYKWPCASCGHPNNNNSNNNYSYDNSMRKFTDSLLTLRTSSLPPLPEFLRFESLFKILLKMTTMQEK